jgi:release factor glutamine methyltransferase
MTISSALAAATSKLPRRPGLPEPGREARWLLAQLLRRPESFLLAHGDEELTPALVEHFFTWVSRRAAGEPAHYIVGRCEFFGRTFPVTPAVLIPRPETELLVEQALSLPLPERARVLDVGTGSGCIAITFALERENTRVFGSDISLAALVVASTNARRLGARVNWLAADLIHGCCGVFNLVVANLPYIPQGEARKVAIEISDHEPGGALYSGIDGADLLRRFIVELPRVLSPDGYALVEIGPGQLDVLGQVIDDVHLEVVAKRRDFIDVDRVITLGQRKR